MKNVPAEMIIANDKDLFTLSFAAHGFAVIEASQLSRQRSRATPLSTAAFATASATVLPTLGSNAFGSI